MVGFSIWNTPTSMLFVKIFSLFQYKFTQKEISFHSRISFCVQIFIIYAQHLLKFMRIVYNLINIIITKQERMRNIKITKFTAKITSLCLMDLSVIFSNMFCIGNWYEPEITTTNLCKNNCMYFDFDSYIRNYYNYFSKEKQYSCDPRKSNYLFWRYEI